MPYCKNCKNTWQLAKQDVEGVKTIDQLPQLKQVCPRCGSSEVILGARDRKTALASGVARQSTTDGDAGGK